MDNVKICETITKLDAKGIKKALMEFADFDIDERNEIFKIQRTHFHRLKELQIGRASCRERVSSPV